MAFAIVVRLSLESWMTWRGEEKPLTTKAFPRANLTVEAECAANTD